MKKLSLLLSTLLYATLLHAQEPVSTPPEIYIEPLTGMEMVFIKGGTFEMGDPRDSGRSMNRPAHTVTVPDFYIGKYEVTFEQYEVFTRATNRNIPKDAGWGRGKRPVINLSWTHASRFAIWLSEQTGKTFRLPTEAQWEYAGRGGTTTDYWWGDELGENKANCRDCGSQWDGQMTAPVGSFPPNPYGLYDMTGNVYEWCLDTLHINYEGAPTDGSMWGFGDQSQHITRGGSWTRKGVEMRSFQRCWDIESKGLPEIGFRLIMEK